MKTLMKGAIAGFLLAGMTITATAQVGGGKTSQQLGEKIANEVLQEMMAETQSSGKQPSPEILGKKMVEKVLQRTVPKSMAKTKPAIASALPIKLISMPYSV